MAVPPVPEVLHELGLPRDAPGADHELRGVPTGFKSLDDILGGFQASDLIIIAARPSVGKTALALDIARRTASEHKTPAGTYGMRR